MGRYQRYSGQLSSDSSENDKSEYNSSDDSQSIDVLLDKNDGHLCLPRPPQRLQSRRERRQKKELKRCRHSFNNSDVSQKSTSLNSLRDESVDSFISSSENEASSSSESYANCSMENSSEGDEGCFSQRKMTLLERMRNCEHFFIYLITVIFVLIALAILAYSEISISGMNRGQNPEIMRPKSYSPSDSPSSFTSSLQPHFVPQDASTSLPSLSRTISPQPTMSLTTTPSTTPTATPTTTPTLQPSIFPTQSPSSDPTMNPTIVPSIEPSHEPSVSPSFGPSGKPSNKPSDEPSSQPSTAEPTQQPSIEPTSLPSASPSLSMLPTLSLRPSAGPTIKSCSCAPLKYYFNLDFTKGCPLNINDNGGIDGVPSCYYNSQQNHTNFSPIVVTEAKIIDFGINLNYAGAYEVKNTTLVNGDPIIFKSATAHGKITGGLQGIFKAINAEGEFTMDFLLRFSNICEMPPFKVGDSLGFLVLVSS